jgi:hypothetical protein
MGGHTRAFRRGNETPKLLLLPRLSRAWCAKLAVLPEAWWSDAARIAPFGEQKINASKKRHGACF